MRSGLHLFERVGDDANTAREVESENVLSNSQQ